ncbi:MAG TPA: SIS domain-containing protein, partial [Candidatus Acidoferrum sp.]|nr:SIS domain-containing protein [Candidatus Acidoferrum sp.]
ALNVGAMFHQNGHPVYLLDADELLRFAAFPKESAMMIISRSGKSTEIVQLAAKARKAGVTVIGITNAPESPLAKEAHTAIVVPIAFDHAISVNTYTTLALAAGLLAHTAVAEKEKADSSASGCGGPQPEGRNDKSSVLRRGAKAPLNVTASMSEPACGRQAKLRPLGYALPDSASETAQARVPVLPRLAELADSLSKAFVETARAIPRWQEQIAASAWLKPHSTTYFLARGSSLGSAYEVRLMWEEGVKSPATAMGTGSFRHGPQEIVAPRAGARPTETADKAMRFGMWIDGAHMREQDLAVARDLQKLGARVMLIGQKLPKDAGDLVFQLPEIQPDWQFLIDIIPAQLVAERLSRLSGVDCDTFRLSSYIVEDEGGLLPKRN